jgi:hypothetical protein
MPPTNNRSPVFMTNETTMPAEAPIDAAPAATESEANAGPAEASDLDAIRAVVLRAHPEAVPELIGGTTVVELLASVGPAEEAYRRIAGRIGRVPVTTPVPAGGDRPMPVDPARLPASEKIRRGLARGER